MYSQPSIQIIAFLGNSLYILSTLKKCLICERGVLALDNYIQISHILENLSEQETNRHLESLSYKLQYFKPTSRSALLS